MGVVNTYLSAVAVGALTAGVAAANVVAVPSETSESPDVELAVTIFDFTLPLGPLTIVRKLVIEGGIDPLELILDQEGGNTYNLPGLNTAYDSTSIQHVLAERVPGQYIDFGWTSDQGEKGGWELLGGVATSTYGVDNKRNLHFKPLLGGTGDIGAALYGTVSDANYTRNLTFLGSFLNTSGNRTVGDFNGELALLPWDGFKVVGGGTAPATTEEPLPPATLIDTNRVLDFGLGSLTGKAESTVTLDGGAGLCLGSAKASCGGNTAFLEVGAPVEGGLTVAGRNIISGDFSDNRVVSTLGNGQFSVTGAVGGTFSIGSLDIGRPIPIDIQIPRNSSMTALSSGRQTQTVRNSFMATPRTAASDNETGGRHRAGPLREAVADIKKAVNDAVSGKHAKPEAED